MFGLFVIFGCNAMTILASFGSSRLLVFFFLALSSLLVVVVSATATDEEPSQQTQREEQQQGHLVSVEHLRDTSFSSSSTARSIRRSGIIDVVMEDKNETKSTTSIGLCHIAAFLAFTTWDGNSPIPNPVFAPNGATMAAIHLAVHMLNAGDGSVVAEIQGLPDHCPIRFTTESFDTSANQAATVRKVNQVLQRTTATTADTSSSSSSNITTTNTTTTKPEVCAFLGPVRSATAVPMAILSGIAGRPQMSMMAFSTQLDDRSVFPLFGRLITSSFGVAVPIVLHLLHHNIRHMGVVHWNDEVGNGMVSALLQVATEVYPELTIVPVDIPPKTATIQDYQAAVDILARTGYRWFFFEGNAIDFEKFMQVAVPAGVAGPGYVWQLHSSSIPRYLSKLGAMPRDDPLAIATTGLGAYSSQYGRPGMPTFDAYAARLRALDNEQDLAYMNQRMPDYDADEYFPSNLERPRINSQALAFDPSVGASVAFDETILLGLAMCKAATAALQQEEDLFVDGPTVFQYMLETSFVGATGNVSLDPTNGSRRPETVPQRFTNMVPITVNETHVRFDVAESSVFVNGTWTEVTPFVYSDGTTTVPPDLPPYTTDFNYIGKNLRIGGLVMAVIVLLASVMGAIWTIVKRDDRIVRASQPIFLLILCLGVFIMGASIIPLSFDDEIMSERACDVSCMVSPWLVSVGFALIFSALFSKMWRINRIFSHPNMRRITLSAHDVMAPLVGLLVINVAVLTVWSVISPLQWTREVANTDKFDRTTESRGYCTSDQFLPFVVLLAVVNMAALIFASYQSYLARGIATEFAESDHVARAIASMLLVSFVGIPTTVLVSDEPKARFFVTASIIFVICIAVLIFIIVPKVRGSLQNSFSKDAIKQSTAAGSSKNLSSKIFSGSHTFTDPAVVKDKKETFVTTETDANSTKGIRVLSDPLRNRKLSGENKKLKVEIERLQERNADLDGLIAKYEKLLGNQQKTEITPLPLSKVAEDAEIGALMDNIEPISEAES